METMVPYAIYLVLGLVGLGMLAVVGFGLRNLAQGKVNLSTVILSGIPIVLLVILGFALGDWATAAIYTVLIALLMATGSLVLSGLRGIIN